MTEAEREELAQIRRRLGYLGRLRLDRELTEAERAEWRTMADREVDLLVLERADTL